MSSQMELHGQQWANYSLASLYGVLKDGKPYIIHGANSSELIEKLAQ